MNDQQPSHDVLLFKLLAGIGIMLAIIMLPYVGLNMFNKMLQESNSSRLTPNGVAAFFARFMPQLFQS